MKDETEEHAHVTPDRLIEIAGQLSVAYAELAFAMVDKEFPPDDEGHTCCAASAMAMAMGMLMGSLRSLAPDPETRDRLKHVFMAAMSAAPGMRALSGMPTARGQG